MGDIIVSKRQYCLAWVGARGEGTKKLVKRGKSFRHLHYCIWTMQCGTSEFYFMHTRQLCISLVPSHSPKRTEGGQSGCTG